MQTPFPFPEKNHITGLILAGGQAKRLQGQDKGLIQLHGKTLVEYAIEQLNPQVQDLIISANRNLLAYQGYGLPVIEDADSNFSGPLAGLLAGLQHIETEWLQCVPCDNPHLPDDLVLQLSRQLEQPALLAIPRWQQRLQPVYSLVHRSLAASLTKFLQGGQRKVQEWLMQQPHCIVDFADEANFSNINTPEELQQAEQP